MSPFKSILLFMDLDQYLSLGKGISTISVSPLNNIFPEALGIIFIFRIDEEQIT
jgi:hypothetical protein